MSGWQTGLKMNWPQQALVAGWYSVQQNVNIMLCMWWLFIRVSFLKMRNSPTMHSSTLVNNATSLLIPLNFDIVTSKDKHAIVFLNIFLTSFWISLSEQFCHICWKWCQIYWNLKYMFSIYTFKLSCCSIN